VSSCDRAAGGFGEANLASRKQGKPPHP